MLAIFFTILLIATTVAWRLFVQISEYMAENNRTHELWNAKFERMEKSIREILNETERQDTGGECAKRHHEPDRGTQGKDNLQG
jgi:predicted PurR-regulated permease PerM